MNVDFADVKTVMSGRGKAMMGSGIAEGETRAEDAVQAALNSPLLDNIDLQGASGVLVNITAGEDLSSKEFGVIGDRVKEIANENATVIIGCIKEEDNLGELRVTLIATGFEESKDENVVDNSNLDEIQIPTAASIASATSTPKPTMPAGYNNMTTSEAVVDKEHVDNIDIPAFLRQQAD